MNELTHIIEAATAEIEHRYFALPIHGGDPIYRERVYCYELYHQMRCLWPKNCAYWLNGEVDKSGHPIMTPHVGGVKPDFLVHMPGDMAGNHAVIEVKPATAAAGGITKDIATLSSFKTAGYDRAIYLIFGSQADRPIGQIDVALKQAPIFPEIEVWAHYDAGTAAIRKI